ncbi:MAG TPA: 50S ribosomal protein L4 [Candidatus Norongarragalinales archaeon]|nr:50S ribosomal protein L4 [Candidatus Norongarragalinales archaeon]
MKAKVLSLSGQATEEVELPLQFEEEFRPDLIRRAYHAYRTQFLQPKGSYLLAGLQTTAEYYGRRHAWRQTINTGRSRLPREKVPGGRSGAVRIVPHSVKGRRAHPPKPWKILREKINVKERSKAIRSALNATLSSDLVSRRHRYNGPLPLIVASPFEEIKRVKEAKKILEQLGLKEDLERAHDGRKIRSGRSRLRKGGYREPKSVLIVFATDKGVFKATRNLPGVESVHVKDLNAELLAPGGQAGRLVLWTKDALDALKNQALFA